MTRLVLLLALACATPRQATQPGEEPACREPHKIRACPEPDFCRCWDFGLGCRCDCPVEV